MSLGFDPRGLSWWEYQALVHGHQPDEEDEPVEAPMADFVHARRDHLATMGIVVH